MALPALVLSACATAVAPAQPATSSAQPAPAVARACTGVSCAADAPRLAMYPADTLDAPAPIQAAPAPAPAEPTTQTSESQPAAPTAAAPAPAGYVAYTPQLFASYLGSAPAALFFHASWCPKCIQLEKDLRSHPDIGAATVLQADYDTEEQLRRTYRVRVQTTVVFFSADGTVHHTILNPTVDDVMKFFAASR